MTDYPAWAKRTVAFDTETTGTDENARIIEFGACVWEDGQVVVHMSWLLNPGDVNLDDPQVRGAFEVNKIDPASLKDKPTFAEMFDVMRHTLSQSDVRVAHNAPFDSRMLRQEFQRAVAAGTLKPDQARPAGQHVTLDTLALDLVMNPNARGRSLAKVAERWGVSGWEAHRASGDAEAAVRILHAMSPVLPKDLADVMKRQRVAQAEWEKLMQKMRERHGK